MRVVPTKGGAGLFNKCAPNSYVVTSHVCVKESYILEGMTIYKVGGEAPCGLHKWKRTCKHLKLYVR